MSGLAGLAAIALAAAHVEQQETAKVTKKAPDTVTLPPDTTRSNPPPQVPMVAKRTPLTYNARLVSTDCVYPHPPPQMFPVAHPPPPMKPVPIYQERPPATYEYIETMDHPVEQAMRILSKIQSELGYSLGGVPPPIDMSETQNPTENDVLCGRGGETNHHAGNVKFRQLVKAVQPCYVFAKRCDKPKISTLIVQAMRMRGGRFLKRPGNNETPWVDVGNQKAREKTSQALREGQADISKATDNGADPFVAPTGTYAEFKRKARNEDAGGDEQQKKKRRTKIVKEEGERVSPTAVSLTDDEVSNASFHTAPQQPGSSP